MTTYAPPSISRDPAYRTPCRPDNHGWWVVRDHAGVAVDAFRFRSGAANAAVALNTGASHVDPHGRLGCRVVQS